MESFPRFIEIMALCRPFTATSVERMEALYSAVCRVIREKIPGDFIECGVYKGGSSMIIAYTLLSLGITERKIYLYDTYEGMTPPCQFDEDLSGRNAEDCWRNPDVISLCPLEEVQKNLLSTEYPKENLIFIKGDVKFTLEDHPHNQIALLRLDTDFYDSTKCELQNLYPLLPKGGICIIDDFGHWKGCRKAVEEYFQHKLKYRQIDYTGILIVKD